MNATRPNLINPPVWAVLLAIALWLHASSAQAANVLDTVSVSAGPGDSQVIKLQLRDALVDEPVAFATSNPHRLVIDLAQTSPKGGRMQETVNTGVIRNYQVVPAGTRTRVVFNLAGAASHEVRRDRNTVMVVLRGAPKQASAESVIAPTVFAETGVKRTHGIRDIEFRRGEKGESRIVVSLSDPGVGIDIQQKGRAIQIDFLRTELPASLQRRLDVSDFATPAQLIETYAQGNNTRMLVTPRGRWDYSAHQSGDQFVMEIRSLDDPTLAKTDKPQYQGEKLTLNFQNVEVRSVLQVIADFTGLNIIASDTVAGNLTLRLKDVPWDQALDIILRAKGLDKRVTGNVIWVAPRDELAAKERMEMEAKRSISDLEPLTTRSYRLNYVKANEAMTVLTGGPRMATSSVDEDATCSPSSSGIRAIDTAAQQQTQTSAQGQTSATRVLSTRGGGSFDLTTNTLIVTDTLERHAAVEEVLKSIDVASSQVMIEARVVLADDNFSRDLGVKLGFQSTGRIDSTRVSTAGTDTASRNIVGGGPIGAISNNVNLPVTGGAPSIGFTILNAAANTMLTLELQALEADSRGKIVSNPRVVTTNLRPAVIMQGTQIPYATASANTGTNIEFKDAFLCLLVAPQVLNNDSIILNVEVTKDAQGVATAAGPAINVRRVKTQVRVNNGETAILGGIFEQTQRDDTEKVPFLGDLPILGHLFRKNSKVDDKTEMLIFLTPRILDDNLGGIR